jgi:hypothetical protein
METRFSLFWDVKSIALPLKMGLIGCPNILVTANEHCISFQKNEDIAS